MTFDSSSREIGTNEIGAQPQTMPVFYCGRVTIDVSNSEVRLAGVEIFFTESEWAILKTLALKPGQIFTKEELTMAIVANAPSKPLNGNTLNVLISSLRQKLGANVIHTYLGRGYCLNCFG